MFILQIPSISPPSGNSKTTNNDEKEVNQIIDDALKPTNKGSKPKKGPDNQEPSMDEIINSAMSGNEVGLRRSDSFEPESGLTPAGAIVRLSTPVTAGAVNSTKFTNFFTATEVGASGLTQTGRILRFTGGRAIPIAGAALSVFDLGSDIYRLGSMKKKDQESDEDFNNRLSTAKSDTLINAGCTIGGAAIGAVICGVLTLGIGAGIGACIGAGIGNIVGNAFKSDGWGRKLCSGIGRLFSW